MAPLHLRRTLLIAASLTLCGPTLLCVGAPSARAADVATKTALTFDGATLTGFPANLKGGLNEITVKNTGKFTISIQLASITGTHTSAEIGKAMNGDGPPKWMAGAGGTGAVAVGGSNVGLVNLDKGTYAWAVSSNGGELDGKKPVGVFSVAGARAKVTLKGDATIVAKEYGFETTGLKAGTNRVLFTNPGKEAHHVIMAKIKPGKTFTDVAKEVTGAQQGPPQTVDLATFEELPLLAPGGSVVTNVKLGAGRYAFVCFVPGPDGKPHAMSGMLREVVIA